MAPLWKPLILAALLAVAAVLALAYSTWHGEAA